MMRMGEIALGLSTGAAILMAASQVAQAQNFNVCPTAGTANTAGCAIVLEVQPGGNIVFHLNGTDSGPYDTADDALVGVWNNSGGTINSIFLDGGATPIFGFENDGICSGSYLSASDCGGTRTFIDPFDYAGPGTFFSGINAAFTSGTVNFTNGLADGGTAFFSLEEAPSDIQTGGGITGTGGTTTTPEPSSLALLGTGLFGLVPMVRRRRSRNS